MIRLSPDTSEKIKSALQGALAFVRRAAVAVGRTAMWHALVNIFWVYVFMGVTRLAFYWENSGLFNITPESFRLIFKGGLVFDTAAILYLNCLWLLLFFFPLHFKERKWFLKAEKWLFVTVNTIALAMNLGDAAIFAFRQHRSTSTMFAEFGGESNLGTIFWRGVLEHWYFILLLAAMAWALWKLYRPAVGPEQGKPLWHYYVRRIAALIFWGVVFVWGVRGGTLSKVTRPISIGYAQRFATEPIDVDLVLNTPFAIIRTLGSSLNLPPAFYSDEELATIYSPVHEPSQAPTAGILRGKNVVFIVLESFSQEFVGSLNPDLEEGNYKGYTPFLDSLLAKSTRFEHTYSNGTFSIDAMPALLASTPRMGEPFVVSPFSINHVTGIGELLKAEGYQTAFFHGADNESLGIQAFVRSAGFRDYYGIEEYERDGRTGGHGDFDGTWGIWDGPFLQYFCMKLGEMTEPFAAGVFTLTSHHPFDLPADVESKYFADGRSGIQATVSYSDHALQRFFESASKQPWFANTIFVVSADHTFLNEPDHKIYNNEVGRMKIPLLIFDPSGTLEPGVRPGIMQQIDVAPTLLGLLGYDKPFFAFGNDVLAIPADSTWGLRWDHVPQLIQDGYVLQLETENWEPIRMYDLREDPNMRRNIINTDPPRQQLLERKLKAILQTHTQRELANDVFLK